MSALRLVVTDQVLHASPTQPLPTGMAAQGADDCVPAYMLACSAHLVHVPICRLMGAHHGCPKSWVQQCQQRQHEHCPMSLTQCIMFGCPA